jgi:hypothetical protein
MKKGDIVLLPEILKGKKRASFKFVYKVGETVVFTHPKTKMDAKGTITQIDEHHRYEDSDSQEVCD